MLKYVLAVLILASLSVGIAYSTFGAGNIIIAGFCGIPILYWKLMKAERTTKAWYLIMGLFAGVNACVAAFPVGFALFVWLKP